MDVPGPLGELQPAQGSPLQNGAEPPSPPSAAHGDFPESPGSGVLGEEGGSAQEEGSGQEGPGPAAYGIQECDTIPGDAHGDGPRYK